jgi:DNA-binding response OmpR family regulator
MIGQSLDGRSIRLIEDEPLIAMGIAEELEKRGARVETAYTLHDAINAVEADGLSAAILDHGLRDGDSTSLQVRLEDRHIPFVIYSGYAQSDKRNSAPFVEKPAEIGVLLGTLEALLKGH